MTITDYVNVSREDGISTIEFATSQSNALPGKILRELKEKILAEGQDEKVNVILLQSGGERAFCAGASFEELLAIENEEQGKNFFMGFAGVINAIRTCGKIVIAKVQGKAVGGGVGIVSAADYCFATKFSAIRLSELAIGIGPFVIGPAVERKTGISQFTRLSITPDDWQTAEWAETHGLYHQVLDDKAELDRSVSAFTEKLSTYNPEALKELKKVFWKGTEHWDTLLEERAEMSGKLILSPFTSAAISRFKKRK